MMSLSEHREKAASLADFLPWAALVAPGIVLNKEGSFQRTACFRGPDLDSSTPAELLAVAARLNSALRRLGSGWTIFTEAQRVPAIEYPGSTFPDAASALVDREREEQVREEGAHYESAYFLTLLWMPPADETARAEGWLYEGGDGRKADPKEWLSQFVDRTGRIGQLLEAFFLNCTGSMTGPRSPISTVRYRPRARRCASPKRPSIWMLSSPIRILLRPVPWTEMLGNAAYFFTVASLPKEIPRPQVVSRVSPPSWVVG